jgi:hypothetical protein
MIKVSLGGFGDKRLECVGGALLSAVQRKRSMCLRRLARDRNQLNQFGRFLANRRVTTHEMLVTQARLTSRRVAGRHVLAIMDTTDLLFPTHEASKRDFGPGADGEHPGLFLHPVVAVDANNGGIIGLVDCAVMNRTEDQAEPRAKRAPDDKESRRWLAGAEAAADCLAEAAAITVVGDRESDIYDLFARRPANVHLLCRSAQARALAEGGLLPAHCASLPEQGRETVEVPAKPGQKAREATVVLRFGAITLKRPDRAFSGNQPREVSLWVVDVNEIDPPKDAEAVHWRLLTTHPVETLAAARQIVAWYRMRWTIEQVFRSMKAHCLQIEASQMEQAAPFAKLALIGLIAAVRAMQLVMARDGTTGQPVTDAVDPADMAALRELNTSLEGRTRKLKNPFDETQLAWFAWIVARLGGWSGYTSRGYRPPGPKTMHHGLIYVDQILIGWHLANRSADVRLH